MNIGDEVVLSAKIIGISPSENPIVEFKSGIRVLVKKSDLIKKRRETCEQSSKTEVHEEDQVI